MIDSPFAHVRDDMDSVVAMVFREAREECAPDGCLVYPVLGACARDAVVDLWDSPIKTFVPLLALRRVRCCVRASTCDCGEC